MDFDRELACSLSLTRFAVYSLILRAGAGYELRCQPGAGAEVLAIFGFLWTWRNNTQPSHHKLFTVAQQMWINKCEDFTPQSK